MLTTLSTKGQVVVPGSIRRKLNLHPGDSFSIQVEEGRIVLTPVAPRRYEVSIQTDPETGMAVAVVEKGAPYLTSEQVAEMLADFP